MARKKFHIPKLSEAVKKKMGTLTPQLANLAVRHFKESFDKKGFVDTRLNRWKNTLKPNPRGSLMMRSGALKRSIRRTYYSPTMFRIEAGGPHVPYAEIHNEGGTIKHPGGTAFFFSAKRSKAVFVSNEKASRFKNPLPRTQPHDIPIPKRQYMGNSYVLRERMKRLIRNEIKKILI